MKEALYEAYIAGDGMAPWHIECGMSQGWPRTVATAINPGAHQMRAQAVRDRRRAEGLAILQANPEVNLDDLKASMPGPMYRVLAETAEFRGRAVQDRREARLRVTSAKTPGVIVSTDEMCSAMRWVSALDPDGPLLAVTYNTHRAQYPGHTVRAAIITRRLGSWKQACELAGVPCRPQVRAGRPMWSWGQATAAVARYLITSSVDGTSAGYRDWASTRPDVPSLATVLALRERIDGDRRWNTVKAEVTALITAQ